MICPFSSLKSPINAYCGGAAVGPDCATVNPASNKHAINVAVGFRMAAHCNTGGRRHFPGGWPTLAFAGCRVTNEAAPPFVVFERWVFGLYFGAATSAACGYPTAERFY